MTATEGNWLRVRTGVALSTEGWRVVRQFDDEPVVAIGNPYATEAEAEAAAQIATAALHLATDALGVPLIPNPGGDG